MNMTAAIWILAFAVSATRSETVTSDERALYNLVEAALTENFTSIRSGLMEFEVEHVVEGWPAPIKVRGTVLWDGDNALWIHKFSDPGEILVGNDSWANDLDNAMTEYRLRRSDSLYFYNAHTNVIHIYEYNPPKSRATTSYLFDVLPQSNWFRCYAPLHGREWREMVGPNSPAMRPGAKLGIERQGNLIVQTRNDPEGGVARATFSLDDCGNPIRFEYEGISRQDSYSATYEWDKQSDGICVLKDYVFKRGVTRDSRDEPSETFRLKIHSIQVNINVAPSRLSVGALISYLPDDVYVVDNKARSSYFLNRNRASGIQSKKLDELADYLRKNGFLSRD